MNTPMTKLKLAWGTMVFAMGLAAFAQAPVISSFSQNGQLVCSNLPAGSVATIEWASSLAGPWRTNWVGLDAVTANSNGVIQVSVPMFYRVRATTNAPINHAPIAVDDNDSTSKNTNLVRATSVYLANDTDADNNPLSITSVSNPVNGVVFLVGTTITFIPNSDFTGVAGFDYTVSDGNLTDLGHVTVIVN